MELLKLSHKTFRTFIFAGILATSSFGYAQEKCASLFSQAVQKISISEHEFDQSTNDLRATLTGKLATVWRSEWKTKLSISNANTYVLEMLNKHLTPETREIVLQGLDIKSEGFSRQVHERMSNLQTANRILPGDLLMVRDKPAPIGAKDTTFTYYTKPIVNAHGEGKHQLRIRTYLREVSYEIIREGQSVQGFDAQGNTVIVSKLAKGTYKVEVSKDQVVQSEQVLTTTQMRTRFGPTVRIHAPHGKSFKLEVKTALNDQISSEKFPLLGGKHMVQKLDVTLSPGQVAKLFAPLKGINSEIRIQESLQRVEVLVHELVTKNPDNKARADAVFNVIKDGIRSNSEYLAIEGATVYHRTAFEAQSGIQTTIDRDQGVYAGSMYSANGLKSPIQTVKNNILVKTGTEDARHVELKVPVTSIENTVGIAFYDPSTAPAPQNSEKDANIVDAVMIFNQYLKNADHSGKFNYIIKNGN